MILDSDIHRPLPQSPDAERGVLCSLMLSPNDVGSMMEERGVTGAHFHIPSHEEIFKTMMQLREDGKPNDFISLTKVLRDRNKLDQCGGAAFVTQLFTFIPTASNAFHYTDILEEKFILRQMIKAATEFSTRSYDEQDNVPVLLDEFEKSVLAIRRSDDGELREEEPKEAVMAVCRNIEELYERRGAVSGQTTGFSEIDQMLDGLHPEEMIVIAARPSMGKTALGMNIAEHISVECKKTVAVFTLEMSIQQLYHRVILSRAHVNMHAVRQGFLMERDFPAITASASQVAADGKLRIVDAIGASISAIRAKARRMARKHPDLACIVVDYLQKARSASKQAQGNREREIAEISSGLKDLAKELRIPVIVLAQLNRDAEKRKAKGRPQLSDLRESGSIEQDADVVGLLYREERYADNEEEAREVEGKATLIIAKNRNGPVGDIPLTFLKEFARYETRAREVEPEQRKWNK